MHHWCSGRISIGFDARVGYVSMRHLTEPAPYTGQVLSPAGAHSVSDGTYLFITERHPVSMECFISVCAINPRQIQYRVKGMITRFDSASDTEISHVVYHASGIFLDISKGVDLGVRTLLRIFEPIYECA